VAVIDECDLEPGALLLGPQSYRTVIAHEDGAPCSTVCSWTLPRLAQDQPLIRHDRSQWLAERVSMVKYAT
jgi:hypothetical protein